MKSVSIAATVAITAVLAVSAAAQSTSDQFLDYYIVKVKPEKRADFDNAAKKIVDANRKNHGSEWLAYQIEYGESNTVYFVSSRQNMAAIDSANEAFMKAMKASFGANFESIFHEMDNCTLSARGELRRRRWDLSSNVPQNPDDLAKITGNARWVRTTMIRVRPGHIPQFEELSTVMKAANEKRFPSQMTAVSQGAAGQTGTVFYASTLVPSLGSLDSNAPSLKDTLGAEEYDKFQKGAAECILSTETMIGRFLPELSNPPEPVVNVTRDFWMPKATGTVAARAKQKKGDAKPNQ